MADCLFCKIIRKEISAKVEYEDEDMLVFHDVNPQAPVHLLMIPKKHIEGVEAMSESDQKLLGGLLYRAKQMADEKGWKHYRLVFNNGAEAGQSVFHVHLHLLSGRRMSWPPG